MLSASSSASAPGGEFQFTDSDFDRVRKLIYRHAGIALSESKRHLVYSRIGRRLRTLGLSRFNDYLELLEGENPAEWELFTNALTTNLTAFFREEHHFPILAEHLRSIGTRRPITLWCAACSTGEEAYSLAITAAETFNTLPPPVRILATDVDTSVLAKAECAVYGADRVERLSPERLRRFFLKGSGAHAGEVKARAELCESITFRQINLLDERWPVRGPLDAIFCRNVMIYFDKATQYAILAKFAPLLRDDGLLFAGHSESLYHAADLFRARGKTVYELASRRRRNGP